MDVNNVAGAGYPAPAPPPPVGASGPAPAAPAAPAPAPVAIEFPGVERSEGGSDGLLRQAVGQINTTIAMHGRHLDISVHEATGRHMVRVYDSVTNEVVREIPPQQVLDAHASLLELAGLFVDARG